MNLLYKYVLKAASIDGLRPLWQPAEDVAIISFNVLLYDINFCLPQINFFFFFFFLALHYLRYRILYLVTLFREPRPSRKRERCDAAIF